MRARGLTLLQHLQHDADEGGAAGDGRGSLLARGAAASNGAGPLPLRRGCTAAGAASGVPPASGVQRRPLESSTNPRAERLGVRLARGLNGLNATFVSGEPVGVSGACVRGIRTGVSWAGAGGLSAALASCSGWWGEARVASDGGVGEMG